MSYTIEFYRFFFVCAVFILHFRGYGHFGDTGAFSAGYLGVDFFFLLSGFLLLNKLDSKPAESDPEKESVSFFSSRYKKLMPQYWISYILMMFLLCGVNGFIPTVSKFGKVIPELLGIQIFWRPASYNGHLWFVSALLWTSPLIYYMVRRNRAFFTMMFFPVTFLVFVAVIYRKYGYVDVSGAERLFWENYCRAFTEIGLGCSLYEAYLVCKEKEIHPVIATVLEVSLLAGVIGIMFYTRHGYWDFVAILLLCGVIFLAFLQKGYLSGFLNNKYSRFLGAISYPMYLNQNLIQTALKKLFPGRPFWPVTLAAIAGLGVLSFFLIRIADFYHRKERR